jgi:hypothetical protein
VWDFAGYQGEGCGDLIGELRGQPAIIAGNAKGVFEEVQTAYAAMGRPVIFAANDVGVYLPWVDHMVSLHTPKLDHWVELRRDATSKGYGNKSFRVHDGGLYGEREWHQWTGLTPMMALSGLFAAQIAWLMGCAPIVLAGCPTDETACFWQPNETVNGGYPKVQSQFKTEVNRNAQFRKALRSMSGWSKEFLNGT